jgi:hypothetical protein
VSESESVRVVRQGERLRVERDTESEILKK